MNRTIKALLCTVVSLIKKNRIKCGSRNNVNTGGRKKGSEEERNLKLTFSEKKRQYIISKDIDKYAYLMYLKHI